MSVVIIIIIIVIVTNPDEKGRPGVHLHIEVQSILHIQADSFDGVWRSQPPPGSLQPISSVPFATSPSNSETMRIRIRAKPCSHCGGKPATGPKDSKLLSLVAVQVPTSKTFPDASVWR